MRNVVGRLRAAILSPAMIALLILFAIFLFMSSGSTDGGERALEERIAHILSGIEGAGEVQVIIRTQTVEVKTDNRIGARSEEMRVPCGAIASAPGAHDPLIKMRITQALCALLGLEASCVEVIESAVGG